MLSATPRNTTATLFLLLVLVSVHSDHPRIPPLPPSQVRDIINTTSKGFSPS
ncbi:hypothetical protein M758_5G178900 [Ceratodon purpureus]|nr:hypothetical protein M758_5G178900 [Ceratodon purpureus]